MPRASDDNRSIGAKAVVCPRVPVRSRVVCREDVSLAARRTTGRLRRGWTLQLLKPGGRLVYSTCSMNPIEDEAVIADLLTDPSFAHQMVRAMRSCSACCTQPMEWNRPAPPPAVAHRCGSAFRLVAMYEGTTRTSRR